MRLAKKIIYWFVALFPILTLVLPLPMSFQSVRGESESSVVFTESMLRLYLLKGEYYAELNGNGDVYIPPDNFVEGYCTVISENVFGFVENQQNPMQQTILKLGYKIEQATGYQMELFLAVFACMYHLFVMYIVEFLMALICFIPKKCSELFGG